MKQHYFLKLSLFLVFFTALQTSAQLIFSESFDYPTGPLQSSAGGTGFPAGSMWSNAGTNATPGNISSNANITAGNVSGSYGTGNKVTVCTEATKTVFFDKAINLTLNDDNVTDYYLGFWFKGPSNLDATTYGIPAQLIFMNTPNVSTANEMRLGFGKTSNITGVNGANALTGFTRASGETCGAASSWPSLKVSSGSNYGTVALGLPDGTSTYYVLVKITKKEFTISAGSPASLQYFDGVRVWFLSAPPTGITDAFFTNRPNGDILTTSSTMPATTPLPVPFSPTDNPIQTRALRPNITSIPAPTGSSQTCATAIGGVNGIRLRVEGTAGYCFEFDEIRLSIGLAGLIVLPVTITDFDAKEEKNTNVLNWEVSSTSDSKGFHVEKSDDGKTFYEVGFVASKGNTSSTVKYSFTDANPSDITYYKLKEESTSGKFSYSKTISLKRNEKISVKIYPNPSVENISIRLSKSYKTNVVTVSDLTGKTVATKSFSGQNSQLDISTLTKGLYLLQVNSDGNVNVLKFMKD
jgi:hypothetical protein